MGLSIKFGTEKNIYRAQCSHCGRKFREDEAIIMLGKYVMHRLCVKRIVEDSYATVPVSRTEALVDKLGGNKVVTDAMLLDAYRSELLTVYEEHNEGDGGAFGPGGSIGPRPRFAS